jgi:hypothetical protein
MHPLENVFPNLGPSGYKITSPESIDYNCIAWAAEAANQWWWPDHNFSCYWPDKVPREETIEAFIQAFQDLGYEPCEDGSLEPNFNKIVFYAHASGRPTHAARQLRTGKWTSKIGCDIDIEHSLEALVGAEYGRTTKFMKRPACK